MPGLLRVGLLWLTIVASVVGILPQFNCLCLNGDLKRISYLSVAIATDCCCQSQAGVEIASSSNQRKDSPRIHSCCSEKSTVQTDPSENGKKCPDKGCKRELAVLDSVLTSTDSDLSRIDFQIAYLPVFSHVPQGCFVGLGNESFGLPFASKPCPPPDLVISLCHLVI